MDTITSMAWGYVGDIIAKIRDKIQYYLEFDGLYKQVRKYLDDTREKVENMSKVIETIDNISRIISQLKH